MARNTPHNIATLSDLLAADAARDAALCGRSLDNQGETDIAELGAHDPTPTPYFVLEELFGHFAFDERSHLLDVGCGTGRVLAYFVERGLPGRATGVELDPRLARETAGWASRFGQLEVLQASAVDLDLSPYTDFYLFNPFDQGILQRFIEEVERQVPRCTFVHMSDNGDTWRYVGRPGWTECASGSYQHFRNARGSRVKVYDHPQHYTVWRYEAEG